jgi:predicted nuclease with TOPRIM domain
MTSKPSGYRQKYLVKSEECEELKRRLGQQHGYLTAANEQIAKLEAEKARSNNAFLDIILKRVEIVRRKK